MVSSIISEENTSNLPDVKINEIDAFIDELISKHSTNSEMMNLMALEATSLATSVKSRSKELEEQGTLSRLFGSITGKNSKISARNEHDLAQTQYLGQKMITKLADNNLMTYQMVVALGDKVNRIVEDTVTSKAELCDLNKRLAIFFSSLRQNLEAKFNSLQRNDDLLFWKEVILFQPVLNSKPYPELTRPEKIINLANEFYRLTQQNWGPRDLAFLKSVIVEVGHNPTEKISLKEVYTAYQDDNTLLTQLLNGVDSSNDLTLDSRLMPTFLAFNKLISLESIEKHIIDTVSTYAPDKTIHSISLDITNNFMKQEVSRDLECEHSFYDLVMNFVEDLATYNHLKQLQLETTKLTLEDAQNEPCEQEALINSQPKITFESTPITNSPTFDAIASGEELVIAEKYLQFPTRKKGVRDELSALFSKDEPIILIALDVVHLNDRIMEVRANGFFKTAIYKGVKVPHVDSEVNELHHHNRSASTTGRTRLFTVEYSDVKLNKTIKFDSVKANEINVENITWAQDIHIRTKYQASNVLSLRIKYLTTKISQENTEQ